MSTADPIVRIIDANFNRAREAARTLDDVARFVLEDEGLTTDLKQLRHELVSAVEVSGHDALARMAARDVAGDVGTTIEAPREFSRANVREIAMAGAARLTEALRSLEEALKCVHVSSAGAIEQLRYRAYAIEARLVLALGTGAATQWRLCVLVTQAMCRHHSWEKVAAEAIEGGADCLQVREKELPARDLLAMVRSAVALARPRGVSVIVNDRPDIALLAGADGVHVGQGDFDVASVRALAGARLLVGVSTSNLDEARQAWADGADYCGVGPMFTTTTKHKPVLAGPEYLKQYVAATGTRPHLAIGGISPANVGALREAGGRGVAVSACVLEAKDPRGVCRELCKGLG